MNRRRERTSRTGRPNSSRPQDSGRPGGGRSGSRTKPAPGRADRDSAGSGGRHDRDARPGGARPARDARPAAGRTDRDTRPGPGRPERDARPGRGGQPAAREASPRVPVPRGAPEGGTWLWTTRPGAERDLLDELTDALGAGKARIVGGALVESDGAPTFADGSLDLTFARQGLRVTERAEGHDLANALAPLLRERARSADAWALSVFVPDTDDGNRLSARAEALEEALLRAITEGDEALAARRIEPRVGGRHAGVLLQVALTGPRHAVAGEVDLGRAISLAPGGRARMHADADRPSRAARKVEEALAWFGIEPGPGEVCVDLGAAPGGWSWALLRRRARVIAVDPALLRPDIAAHRGLTHAQQSAFEFVPDEPVDWLFCDMAWKPVEVAQMLAKWGRRRWARLLVANLKLPMKQKAKFVADCRAAIHGGGWRNVRTRQLYHDREEITLLAHLG